MAKEPVLEVAFSGGIDESTRDELADAARTFPVRRNTRQVQRGGASKRLGYASLAPERLDATTRSAGRKLFSHGTRLCTVDGANLDVYSEQLACSTVVGRVSEASVRLLDAPSTLGPSGGSSNVEDVALANGCLVLLQNSGVTSLSCSVLDVDGTILRAPEVVVSGAVEILGGLGSYGDTVLLVAVDLDTANIKLYSLDCSTAAGITTGWVSRGTVVTDHVIGASSTVFDVCSLEDRVAFAYVNNSGGTSRLTVKTVTTAGTVETRQVNTSSTTPTAAALAGSIADTLWVTWNEGVNVKVCGLDADSLASTLASTALAVSPSAAVTSYDLRLVVTGTGTGRVYCNAVTDETLSTRPFSTVAGATTMGTGTNWLSVYLASKVYARVGRYYAFAYAGGATLDTNSQGVFVLVDLTDTTLKTVRPVASVEPGLAVAPITRRAHILESGTKAYSVLALARTGDRAAAVVELDFAATTRWQAVEHAGSTYLTGGILAKFDGSRFREAGFLVAPRKPTSVRAAGTLSPTVGYRWVATYETCDGDGNWVSSGVSTPSDLSGTTALSQYTVTTSTLSLTARFTASGQAAPERICFWRTTDGGTTYYLVAVKDNLTSASTVSFVDATADTALVSARKLYAPSLPGLSGSSQDRRAPPGFSCLVSYNDMLVGSTGSTLWHSSQSVVGEGVWFNPLFRLDMVDGGEVTALAAQDGTLFVFKRRNIFAVTGEPPADNGSSGGLGTPRKLACDVGCIDPRSVVVTSLGIFFQSERGLELLTRGQSIQDPPLGEQVQETLATYPVITSATLDSAAGLVRFTCATSETDHAVSDTGVHLVFDLAIKVWVSVDDVTTSANASRSAQSACMVYVGGAHRFAWLDKSGTVLYERAASDASAHLDGSSWVTQSVETANVHIAGLQGEQNIDRLLLLAQRHTDHDLTIEVAHDYSGSYNNPEQAKVYPASLLATLGRQWLDRELVKSTSQALKVRISDATPTSGTVGTGKGATWVALTFNGERKSGPRRTSSAERGT